MRTTKYRTDLAAEAYTLWQQGAAATGSLEGVTAREETVNGFSLTHVEILNELGSKTLCKPTGNYDTLSLPEGTGADPERTKRWCRAAAKRIQTMLPDAEHVLVVGLGNPAVTPDSIGPGAADAVLATRHLQKNTAMHDFECVSVIRPGVLGDTGMESAELVKAAVGVIGADCMLVMDALAATDPARLCCTLQITDTGIVPGSGVGNHRSALNESTMGVPVIALGVPTVIDAAAFSENRRSDFAGLFVSPRDMDIRARRISRLLGMSVNLALHPRVAEDLLWELVGIGNQ